ncbi:hypothetical protein [Peterkaempfera sp. SMS 1(5)a]|uniref:hypothetical protein n=1 Tax=Peterkaempfera podocarpi TaxID=3232308 RepID=UPI003673257E
MLSRIGRTAPTRTLLAVSAAYAAAGLLLVPPTLGLGWDEIVYTSQYGSHAPAAFFSAPRSRGIPFLTAPVTALTDSTTVLRIVLALAAAVALHLGFRPWLRLAPRPSAVPLAAALYGSLWVSLFYAGSAMPNHYTAMAATAATGYFLLAVRRTERSVVPRLSASPRPDPTDPARTDPAPAGHPPAGHPLAGHPPAGHAPGKPSHPVPSAAQPFPTPGAAPIAAPIAATRPASPLATSTPAPTTAAEPTPLATRPGPRRSAALWGCATALTIAGLMRPSDAVWIALPLLAAALLVPAWRRPARIPPVAPIAAVLGGLAAGVLPWVVEAELSFGGLRERLHQAQQIQGGTRLTFTLPEVLASADGPLLCRPCSAPLTALVSPAALWWCVLLACAGLGTVAAHRSGRPATAWLPLAVAASTAATYVFLIDYSAPRFLLPGYALLALPAAAGMLSLLPAARPRPPLRTALLVLLLLGYAGVQVAVLHRTVRVQAEARNDWAQLATALHRAGVSPPCVVTGTEAIPVAYYARCRALEVQGNNGNTTEAALLAESHRRPTAMVLLGYPPPPWARDWPATALHTGYRKGWQMLLPPWTPRH